MTDINQNPANFITSRSNEIVSKLDNIEEVSNTTNIEVPSNGNDLALPDVGNPATVVVILAMALFAKTLLK